MSPHNPTNHTCPPSPSHIHTYIHTYIPFHVYVPPHNFTCMFAPTHHLALPPPHSPTSLTSSTHLTQTPYPPHPTTLPTSPLHITRPHLMLVKQPPLDWLTAEVTRLHCVVLLPVFLQMILQDHLLALRTQHVDSPAAGLVHHPVGLRDRLLTACARQQAQNTGCGCTHS